MARSISYIAAGLITCVLLTATITFAQNQNSVNADTVHGVAGDYHYVKGITAGRARSLIGVAFAITSLIAGLRARRNSKKATENFKIAAIVAVFASLLGIALSIIHLTSSARAALGSGSGKAGAVLAMLLSLAGAALSISALRQKKSTRHLP